MIHEEQQMIDLGIQHNDKIRANIRELHQPFPQLGEDPLSSGVYGASKNEINY